MTNSSIATDRLYLEPMSQLLARDILDRRRQADWAVEFPAAGEVKAATWVSGDEQFEQRRFPFLTFVVRERSSGLLIGGAGFHGSPKDRWVELGYGLASAFHRRGYATEACRALVEAALSSGEVDAVVASTDPDNVASQAVLRRSGFVATTEARTYWVHTGAQPTTSSRN